MRFRYDVYAQALQTRARRSAVMLGEFTATARPRRRRPDSPHASHAPNPRLPENLTAPTRHITPPGTYPAA